MMERTSMNLGAAGGAIVSGGNPFFRSLNQSYGEPWKSSGGVNPLHLQETPEYKDLVSLILHIHKWLEIIHSSSVTCVYSYFI